MGPGAIPDWPREINLLRKLLPMASRVHVVAADALLHQFSRVSKELNGEHEAKLLAIKLIAEAMSALEDFGALCHAVRLRADGGIIWQYRNYKPGKISEVYQELQKEDFAWNYLRLPWPDEYFNNPDADNPNLIWDISELASAAANWQQAKGMLAAFNTTKHGFVVLDSPPAEEPVADDDALFVVERVSEDGEIECIRVQDFDQWVEKAKMVIASCADAWRDLASLVIFLHENGYALGSSTPAPSPAPPARG